MPDEFTLLTTYPSYKRALVVLLRSVVTILVTNNIQRQGRYKISVSPSLLLVAGAHARKMCNSLIKSVQIENMYMSFVHWLYYLTLNF